MYTILYYTILYYTILYYTILTIPSILAIPEISISRLRLKFFQLDITFFILKSTHFQFELPSKFWIKERNRRPNFFNFSNINPSNQHPHQVTVMKHPTSSSIAIVPINTLLIPDIDTLTPFLAFIILIQPWVSSPLFPQWKSVRRQNSNENAIKDGGSTVSIKRHLLVNNAILYAFSAQAIKWHRQLSAKPSAKLSPITSW